MTRDTLEGVILGAVLGSLIIPAVLKIMHKLGTWWRHLKPGMKPLQTIAEQEEKCKIFVRDFFIKQDAELYLIEPRLGIGKVPNVHELWPDVEGSGEW